MTKNKPLRSIDQRVKSNTPPPTARPTKFNPYTGGIIKGEEQARYRIFLDSDEDWVLKSFSLRKSATDASTLSVKIRVPTLVIRIFNPNFSVDRIRVYLAFSKTAFDDDPSTADSSTDTSEPGPNLKIVSFTTTTVQSINSNNASREISAFVESLIRKHTFFEILQLMYEDMTLSDFTAITSDDELITLFNQGLSNLKVFAQAAFIPLNPVNDIDNTPYILRSAISCSYRLTPDQLRNADMSDTSLTISSKNLVFTFNQVSLKSIQYNIKNESDTSVVNPTTYAIPERNGIRPRKVTLTVDVSNFVSLNKKFNQFTARINSTQVRSLLTSSFLFKLFLTSVLTAGNEIKNGADIAKSFDVPTQYSVSYGSNANFTEAFTVQVPLVNLIEGFRNYRIVVSKSTSITGVLLIYRFANNTYVPRYHAFSSITPFDLGSSLVYSVIDYMKLPGAVTDTFRLPVNEAVSLEIYPVNEFGKCSIHKVTYSSLANLVNISRDLQGNANGYYRQSMTVTSRRELVLSPGTRIDAELRLEIPFRIVVDSKQNGLYRTVYTSPTLYYAKVTYTGLRRTIRFETQAGAPVTRVNLSTYLGSTGYRVRLVPDDASLKKNVGAFTQINNLGHIGIVVGG